MTPMQIAPTQNTRRGSHSRLEVHIARERRIAGNLFVL
jgi:hypothetical protein